MSESEFDRLVKEEPDRFLALLPTLPPYLLTYAAEVAGRELDDRCGEPLLALLKHESALVREGAIYGLAYQLTPTVVAALKETGQHDSSPGVRTAARDVIAAFDPFDCSGERMMPVEEP